MKRVEIEWRDAKRYTYQMYADEKLDICRVKSIGYLISMDKKQVAICQDNLEGDIRGVEVIPRENVIKIKYF